MRRKTVLMTLSYVVLVLIIIAETGLLAGQYIVNKRIQAQSDATLSRFLGQAKPSSAPTGNGTNLLLKNVTFCWSKAICIDSDQLTAQAQSLRAGTPVDFDNPSSFIVNVNRSQVTISPGTLQGMFNESVFNYPGSKLRDLGVTIVPTDAHHHHIKLSGSINYLFWIPFNMDVDLVVDHAHNTLNLVTDKLHIFGILPVKFLLNFHPFYLEKLLPLPKNQHLLIHQNTIMIKPFGLFPPPRINGRMGAVVVQKNVILLRFDSDHALAFTGMPQPGYPNTIYLSGGATAFGKLRMVASQIQVLDANPSNPFKFSLRHYLSLLPKSRILIQPDGAVVVHMPDAKI